MTYHYSCPTESWRYSTYSIEGWRADHYGEFPPVASGRVRRRRVLQVMDVMAAQLGHGLWAVGCGASERGSGASGTGGERPTVKGGSGHA